MGRVDRGLTLGGVTSNFSINIFKRSFNREPEEWVTTPCDSRLTQKGKKWQGLRVMAKWTRSKIVTIGEFLEASQLFFWILWSIAKSVWVDFSHTCLFHCQEHLCGISFAVWRFLRWSNTISCGQSSKKRFFGSCVRLRSLFRLTFHTLVLFVVRKTSVELILVFEAFWDQAMRDFAVVVWENCVFEWETVKNLNNLEHVNRILTGTWYDLHIA